MAKNAPTAVANCTGQKKKEKWIHKRKEKRKNIEKLMAKFENYANQSATMGVMAGGRVNWGSSVIRELFKFIGKMKKKKLFSWQAKKCNWNVYLN